MTDQLTEVRVLTWFEVWGYRISPVEIQRYTDASIWIGGQRQGRNGWRSYFPTWEEAHAHLVAKAEADLKSARLALERAQGRHGLVKGMKPPVKS